MNLSLKRRIATSFIIANMVVLIMGFTVFYFLDTLNRQVEKITQQTNNVSLLTDEIRISAVSILKTQKRILTSKAKQDDLQALASLCEGFQSQLQRLDTFYEQVEVKKIIAKMQGLVEALMSFASKTSIQTRDSGQLATIGELADKILEAFSEFQDIQYFQNELRDKQIKKIIEETRRNMLITLIITFLGTILLGLVIPGKIALPFKKINDAIRELQDCNFDVSIYYEQDDEIGELAREINKMITNFKAFEELRTDRISIENRKFDALANLSTKYILVANAKGELIYMNNTMYSLLKLESDDVLRKNILESPIPDSIKEAYELAIKRRSKIENAEIVIYPKIHDEDEQEEVKPEFSGYANVIPIRGKQSLLDYYLMVVSKDVFE
jgi:PAS domain-containing protein